MVESKESSHITIVKKLDYEPEKPVITLSPRLIGAVVRHRILLAPKSRPLSMELESCEGEQITTPQGTPLIVPTA